MKLSSMLAGRRLPLVGTAIYAAMVVLTACGGPDAASERPENAQLVERAVIPSLRAPPPGAGGGGPGPVQNVPPGGGVPNNPGQGTPPPGGVVSAPAAAASLAAVWYNDQSITGSPLILVRPIPSGVVVLPPTYASGNPEGGQVHFVWQVTGLSSADLANLAGTTGGWSLALTDESLQPISSQTFAVVAQGGPVQPNVLPSLPDGPPGAYLDTSIGVGFLATLPQVTSLGGEVDAWHLQLSFANSVSSQSALALGIIFAPIATPAPTADTYFETLILPTFRDPRCSNCHKLGQPQEIVNQHILHGQPLIDLTIVNPPVAGHFLNKDGTALGSNLTCSFASGCHGQPEAIPTVEADVQAQFPGVTFKEEEWKTPADDEDLNWSLMTDKEVCETVRRNLIDPMNPTDYSKVDGHFFQDARIAWSVNGGNLPAGYVIPPYLPSLPIAPPYGYGGLVAAINGWTALGAPCPP